MSIVVIGGGITGQLVQIVAPESEILDWRPRPPSKLTRAFGANYLWEPLRQIPCRSFPVITHVDGQPATLESVARYKSKIGKMHDVENWGTQFQTHTVGYELENMPVPRIMWDRRVVGIDGPKRTITVDGPNGEVEWHYSALISTVPLYALIDMVTSRWSNPWPWPDQLEQLKKTPMEYRPIYVKITARPPDAPFPPSTWYVNYLSTEVIPYRYTDRGEERHYESIVPMPGIPSKRISPGKIYSHPHRSLWLTRLREWGNIYCFGRFARWDPDELVHQTYQHIENWYEKGEYRVAET